MGNFLFMNKAKRRLQQLTALGTIGIGIYMFVSYAWPAPPAVSGIGFILAGLGLWIPHCPLVHALVGDKSQPTQ